MGYLWAEEVFQFIVPAQSWMRGFLGYFENGNTVWDSKEMSFPIELLGL